jgi:hypothetical protein
MAGFSNCGRTNEKPAEAGYMGNKKAVGHFWLHGSKRKTRRGGLFSQMALLQTHAL